MVRPSTIRLVLLIACSFLFTTNAWSQDLRTKYIRADFNDALERARGGELSSAMTMFQDLLDREPSLAEAAWNAAELARRAERWQTCSLYYRNYLYQRPDAQDADLAKNHIRTCERKLNTSGSLDIQVTAPSGVEIAVDTVVVGKGSIQGLVLQTGNHTVTASLPDYEPFSQTVRIKVLDNEPVQIRLNKIVYEGRLILSVSQPGAVVKLDGKAIAQTPFPAEGIMLPARDEALLSIEKEGFRVWQRYISIPRNSETEIEIELLPKD